MTSQGECLLERYLCYSAQDESVTMAEEAEDDKCSGASSCLNFQKSNSSFESGSSISDVDKKTQRSVIVYLYMYEHEDSGSVSETGECSFVSLTEKHLYMARTLPAMQFPVAPAFFGCRSLIILRLPDGIEEVRQTFYHLGRYLYLLLLYFYT